MIHLLETKLPNNKQLHLALTHIYGINKRKSLLICKKLGFSKNFKVFELSNDHIFNIVKLVDFLKININSNLLKIKRLDKQKLVDIKSYRGIRRIKGFPVRGQRTRSNSKTAKKLNKIK